MSAVCCVGDSVGEVVVSEVVTAVTCVYGGDVYLCTVECEADSVVNVSLWGDCAVVCCRSL